MVSFRTPAIYRVEGRSINHRSYPHARLTNYRNPDDPEMFVDFRTLGRILIMKTTRLVFSLLVAAGMAAGPFAAQAKHHKAKHHSSMSSKSMSSKKNDAANPSSEGNVGPGTNQAGNKPTGTK